MLRAALLSSWHVHAGGYAREFARLPDCKIAAVWDENAERGRDWAEKLGVPFEAELERVVAREDVDCVICNAPTNRHAEVMVAAADAKKHIFTEKAMALTVAECDLIAAAVRRAGVTFTISMPRRTAPDALFVKQAIEEGWLGEVTFVRARVAHSGVLDDWLPPHFLDPVETGGGALMDLGCHPMYTTRWLLGEPARVSARLTHRFQKPVDDNAVCTIEFKSGALAVVEASFVNRHSPGNLEVHGTLGTFYSGGPEGEVRFISDVIETPVKGWVSPRLPKALPSALAQWVASIRDGEAVRFGLDDGRALTELMEAAAVSSRERRSVELPL